MHGYRSSGQRLSHLLALLGQLVLTGDDLHGVCLPIALVLDERHRAVRAHLTCPASRMHQHHMHARHRSRAGTDAGSGAVRHSLYYDDEHQK